MFKKGSFEIGGTIYPVAIKVKDQKVFLLYNRVLLKHLKFNGLKGKGIKRMERLEEISKIHVLTLLPQMLPWENFLLSSIF